MLLRSGRYLSLPLSCPRPTNTISFPADSTPSPSSSISSPRIKLLHQNTSIKIFSGEDANYSALSFSEACGDSMGNSNITTDSDKTAFVRSNLTCDSLASQMMQASSFTRKLINYDYSVFRKNFLTAFGIVYIMTLCNGHFTLLSPLLLN